MRSAGEKLGAGAGKMGATLGKMGAVAEIMGAVVWNLGAAFQKMGAAVFAMGIVVGKMGAAIGKTGAGVGALGAAPRNWGRRPGNDGSLNSRSVWGIKFLRSGRELFARWLSIKLPTVTRMLMECGSNFSKKDGGRQAAFSFSRQLCFRRAIQNSSARKSE